MRPHVRHRNVAVTPQFASGSEDIIKFRSALRVRLQEPNAEWSFFVAWDKCDALDVSDCGEERFFVSVDLAKRECSVVLHDCG